MDTVFSFGPDPGSAQLARNIVRRVLEDQSDELRETAALLTSELVTNAVIHTRHPFELNVERLDDRIRVTVADASVDEPVVRDIDPARERGQGLIIVRALSTVWGVGRHPNGKSVWFVLRLDATRAGEEPPGPGSRDGERRGRRDGRGEAPGGSGSGGRDRGERGGERR